jgi:hypothetical protein
VVQGHTWMHKHNDSPNDVLQKENRVRIVSKWQRFMTSSCQQYTCTPEIMWQNRRQNADCAESLQALSQPLEGYAQNNVTVVSLKILIYSTLIMFHTHFNIFLPSTTGSSRWSLSFRFPLKTYIHLFFPPYMPHAAPISFFSISSPK